jgi:hypothetical protein
MPLVLVQMDCPHPGPWGDDLAVAMEGLAREIATEPGLVFKYWTEDPASGRAGGVYAFEDRECAEAYAARHAERLASFGYAGIRSLVFDVNEPLSRIGRAPCVCSDGAEVLEGTSISPDEPGESA